MLCLGACLPALPTSPTRLATWGGTAQGAMHADFLTWQALARAIQVLYTKAGCRTFARVPIPTPVAAGVAGALGDGVQAVLLLASTDPDGAALLPKHP